MIESALAIQAGYCSLQGRRADNQDFGGYTEPGARELYLRGAVAAVADGMGGAKGGRVAAETAVRNFIDAYYSLPETLSAEQRAARALTSCNAWIHAIGQRDADLAGMATTFSALLLHQRQAHLIHVGDSRIYRLRGDSLERLTEDHTLKAPDLDHILYRAVGIESALRADFATHPLEQHDRFLVCSDGLYAVVRDPELRRVLQERGAPQATAEALAELALERGSQDNITALVVDVISLPPPNRTSLGQLIGELPIAELPAPGQTVDNYRLESVLSSGRYSCLFLARDLANQNTVVLKFPHPRVASEREYYDAFLREAWIGARVHSPWLAEVIEQPPGRQSRLYSVLPFYPGQTLEQSIVRKQTFSLAQGVDIALKLCKAVHALHRQHIVHRDIKPDNILLLDDGGLKLLDLGVARLPAWDEDADAPMPGTASYMAPELFAGERGSEASDVFALGVTLYRMFSRGAYPYGEIEPFSTPRFHKPKSLAAYRPDLPSWLDAVLAKAIAVDPGERHGDAIELALELENGLARGGQRPQPKRSLYERDPLRFWRVTSALLLLALLLNLVLTHAQSRCGNTDPHTNGASSSSPR